MSAYFQYLCVLVTLSVQYATSINTKHPLILVVSFDGFRHDYLDRGITPNLLRARSASVTSKYMKNVFPTKTYGNHHSMATGLYPEQHGVIDNHYFDVKTSKEVRYSEEMFCRPDVVPIYTLNELGGSDRYSGVMMWPGADCQYQNHSLTYHQKFVQNASFTGRVDEVISWFLNQDRPANFVMLYFEEPDSHGHMYGPVHEKLNEQIKRCDDTFKYLLDQLEMYQLRDRMNLFVLSDHGMSDVSLKHVIDLTQYVSPSEVTFGGQSPTLGVFPAEGKEDEVYGKLSKAADELGGVFKVYKKADMPDRWHYKNNERVPPLLALASDHYAFQDIHREFAWFKEHNRTLTNDSIVGVHGYDNTESMYPMFFAQGPLLAPPSLIPPFSNVQLFPLWCHMLGLTAPSPPNLVAKEGFIFNLLAESGRSDGASLATGWYLGLAIVLLLVAAVFVFVYTRSRAGHDKLFYFF